MLYWNIAVSPKEKSVASKALSAEQMQSEITTDALFNAINEARVTNNVTPFSRNPKLDESSKLKCDDMVAGNYYEHINSQTGKHGYDYINDVGQQYEAGSENLNQGFFKTAKDVVDSWMQSESHKASITDPKFTEIGFATCIVPQWSNQLTIVQHKIQPYSKSEPSGNQTSTYLPGEKPSAKSCNMSAKEQQDYYYNEIVKSINVQYELNRTSPNPVDQRSADSHKEHQLSQATSSYNTRIIDLGCLKYVKPI